MNPPKKASKGRQEAALSCRHDQKGEKTKDIGTFVNVRGVSLFSRLVALLLVASRRRGLLASLFLLCGCFSASRCLSAGGGGLLFSSFGRHFGWI